MSSLLLILLSLIGVVAASAISLVIIFKPPQFLLDASGNIRHERIKVAFMIFVGGIAGVWAVNNFISSGTANEYRYEQYDYERKKREDLPAMEIDIDVTPQMHAECHYFIVTVEARNQGKSSISFKLNEDVLVISRLDTDDQGAVSVVKKDGRTLPKVLNLYTPANIKIESGQPDYFRAATVEPESQTKFTFLHQVPEYGVYFVQFKAQVNPVDPRLEKIFTEMQIAERPVYWEASRYYIYGKENVAPAPSGISKGKR